MGSTEQKTLQTILQAIIDQGNLTVTEVNTSVGSGTDSLEVVKNIKLQELAGAAGNHTITLEAKAQELVKYISEQGFRIRINQANHGFTFNPIQFETGLAKYVKATKDNPADAMAIRVDNDNFDLVTSGSYPLSSGIKDVFGKDLVEDEYYFLDENVAGGFTPIKPIRIYQPLFLVAKDKGKLRALIEVETPTDLEPRILNDFFDEQVERVVNTADEKIEEIKTTQGMKGDKGDKGDTGAVGPQGIQGIQGIQGNVGPQGPQGLKGDKGDQGIQGIQGVKGDTGIQGPTGPQGDKGDKGDSGSLVNIANNEEIDLWLGTTADYDAIVEKSRGVLYQHFDEDGNFAGGYYKRLLTPVTRGLIEHFDFADGKGTETTLKSRVSDKVLTLRGFNFDENSGWTGKGLRFDGVDDLCQGDSALPNNENKIFTIFLHFEKCDTFYFNSTSVTDGINWWNKEGTIGSSEGAYRGARQFIKPHDENLNVLAMRGTITDSETGTFKVEWITENGVFQRSTGFTRGLQSGLVKLTRKQTVYSYFGYTESLTDEEIKQQFEYMRSIDRNVASTYPLLQEQKSYGIGLTNQLSEEQKSKFRLSIDRTKFVAGLRYCEGLEVEEFTYSEIQVEMEKEEWSKIEEV